MPAPVAIRAASTLVCMPPVPSPAGAGPADRGRRSRSASAAHVGDQPAPGGARVGVVEPVDVGEQHQQVGVHEVGDQGGEPVVVAEPDLGGGDRVVLVDDRQHAELEQLGEGLVGVAVVRAPGHVVERSAAPARPRRRAGRAPRCSGARAAPGPTDAAACWAARPRGRRLQPERREPGGDRARRHQDDLGPAARAARRATSTSARTRSGSMPPSAVVSDDEPTLTTTRRAAGDLGAGRRCPRRRAGVVSAQSGSSPGADLVRRRAELLGLVEAAGHVGAGLGLGAVGHRLLDRAAATVRPGRCSSKRWSSPRRPSISAPASMPGLKSKTTALSGCPMSTVSPSLGAELDEPRLDAEPVEPVGEEADGLVVAEVGLADPALGLLAAHPPAVAGLAGP